MAVALGSRSALRLRLLLSQLKPGIRVSRAGPAAAFGTSVTSAKVAVNGVHLHYQRTGEGEHAVLLLPGMLGSGETDFGPQLKNLSKKLFTVVAWDPRGYGHSRPPDRDFPVDFFERDAKDAIDLMKALQFKKVSLLGWSDGGITALIAAAKYPSYVRKMVIWGANAYVTDEDVRIYQGIRDVSKWSEKARKPLEALYGYDYFAKTCEQWVDGIQQFKRLPDGNICRHLLPLVQCPTLIVHGEKDPLVPRFHADFLHEHAILDIRGLVGHPQNWLEEFLESPSSGSARAVHIKPVTGTGVVGREDAHPGGENEEDEEPWTDYFSKQETFQ